MHADIYTQGYQSDTHTQRQSYLYLFFTMERNPFILTYSVLSVKIICTDSFCFLQNGKLPALTFRCYQGLQVGWRWRLLELTVATQEHWHAFLYNMSRAVECAQGHSCSLSSAGKGMCWK